MNTHNNINSLIIENQYFGCVDYYLSLFKFSNIIIEQYESWQKMSFRNRCVIQGANGMINLTIPLENGRDQKCLIKEVKINNREDWQKQHLRSIFSSYGKSPFFEFYRDWLESFYQKKQSYLFDMNLEILFWLKDRLKIQGAISLSDTFAKEYPEEADQHVREHSQDNCRQIHLICVRKDIHERKRRNLTACNNIQ